MDCLLDSLTLGGFPNSIANNIAATYLRFLHTHKGFSVLKSQNFNHVAATLLELEKKTLIVPGKLNIHKRLAQPFNKNCNTDNFENKNI